MTMKESTLSKRITDWLNAQPHGYARKVKGGPSTTGCADIMGCWKGRALVLETKLPGGKVSRRQEIELRRAAKAGAIAAVVTSLECVQELVAGI